MSYLSEFLHRIGTKSRKMYNMFYLHPATWTWITALGIKRQPRQYRGSRAGRSVFDHIYSGITSCEEKSKSNSNMKWSVVLTNLLNIQPTMVRHIHLSSAHVSAQSIGDKIGPFEHYLQDKEIDLCAVTETWLKPDDLVLPREITPPRYYILSQPRSDGRQGGGVVLVYNSSQKVHNITQGDQQGELEYMNVHVKFRNKTLNLYIIYRHPNTSVLQFI